MGVLLRINMFAMSAALAVLFVGKPAMFNRNPDASEFLVSDQFVDTLDAYTQYMGHLCALEQRSDINKA